jgi:arsenate reductase
MKRVLFVCTHNAARSQIAEGLLKLLGNSEFEVSSAGLELADEVHPLAIAALHERFIDTAGMKSKVIDDELLSQEFDLVVTVCDHAKDHCPVFPYAKETLHWSIEDPSEVEGSYNERLEAFRETRMTIEKRIKTEILRVRV